MKTENGVARNTSNYYCLYRIKYKKSMLFNYYYYYYYYYCRLPGTKLLYMLQDLRKGAIHRQISCF